MRHGQKTLLARRLRSNMTDAEQQLWRQLRLKQLAGHRFRRQHPIGPFVADFACLQARLVIEVDGGQHAGSQMDIDRDAYVASRGFLVLRFWNHDVLQNMIGVVETIMRHLDHGHPHPGLPPQAGEGAEQGAGLPPQAGEGAEQDAGLPAHAGEGAEQGARLPAHSGEGAEQGARLPAHSGEGVGQGHEAISMRGECQEYGKP